jgi:CheY-like chemotaxis protein
MELPVTHVVRRSPSFSPSHPPSGSGPAKAALSHLAVTTSAMPPLRRGQARPDSHPITASPSEPVQTTPSMVDPETSSTQPALDPDHKLSRDTNVRTEARTTRSILVVEDDPDIAMALQDLLEFEGFHVDCVQTCRQAFSSIEHNAYHAILLDLGLPDGDGCSILEKLQVSHPTLPVIVLTASHRNLGSLRAYAHLTKPWEREALCTILRHAIGMA